MKRVTWNGGPGHVFNALNVTLVPGDSVDLEDELADALVEAEQSFPNPGQLDVAEIKERRAPAHEPAESKEAKDSKDA